VILPTCYDVPSALKLHGPVGAVAYPECFQVVHRDLVAKQMQQSILQHTSVTVSRRSKTQSARLRRDVANVQLD
jgi:hypothetical protein